MIKTLFNGWLRYCYSSMFLWTVSIFAMFVCLMIGIKYNSIFGWLGSGCIWTILWTRFLNYKYGSQYKGKGKT